MVAAEGGAVGCALLKDRYTLIEQSVVHYNRTTDCSIRVYRSFSRDAASQSTRFTVALYSNIYTCLATPEPDPELPACNIARKNFMRIIGNDKSIK